MDKGIRLQKEIAMGIASKSETAPGNLKKNLKCGGMVKKTTPKSKVKGKK
jgi:hypothetical protein